MSQLQDVFTQLGIGGGVLCGLPLAVMGLALRGLTRHTLARVVTAGQHRRRVADLVAEGPVMLAGHVRRGADGQASLAEAASTRSVRLEVPVELRLRDGERVLVFGTASREAGRSVGYRDDARAWSIDARGDEAMVLVGASSLGARITRLRVLALLGAVSFAIGLVIMGACIAAATLNAG